MLSPLTVSGWGSTSIASDLQSECKQNQMIEPYVSGQVA